MVGQIGFNFSKTKKTGFLIAFKLRGATHELFVSDCYNMSFSSVRLDFSLQNGIILNPRQIKLRIPKTEPSRI